MTWRIFANRLNGDGTETLLRPELPVTSCPITDPLSAPGALTIALEPETIDPGLFVPWSTAVYAERDGTIYGAGIVKPGGVAATDQKLSVECVGWADYITGMPWVDKALSVVSTDPGRLLAKLWATVQAHPHGNLGLEVPTIDTGRTVGTPKKSKKVPAEPFVLAAWETADLGATMTTLITEGRIEYRERHWWDGDTIRHELLAASPRIGRRLTDARLVIGENVTVVPTVEDGEYASEVVVLGAGEGTKKIIARTLTAAPGRLRRVYVVNQDSITRAAAADTLAARLLALLAGTGDDIETLVVADSPAAPVGLLTPGDEVLLTGTAGWAGDVAVWLRVIGRTFDPIGAPDRVTLDVVRADKIG